MRIHRTLLAAVTLLLCMAGSAHAASTWALLVGVSKYQNPQISSLRFPAADAAGIRDALVDPKLGAVPASNVRLLADEAATGSAILGAVDTFLKPNVKPGDQVIVFLAGHGVVKGVGTEGKSFLLPTDVKGLTTASLEASAVDLKALSAKLGALPASQFVLFVDACREDPTPGRGVKGNLLSDITSRSVQIVPQDPARPASSVTFFACGVGQRAFEDPTLKHGVFTYWILNGIQEGAVPQRPDGAVDMGRLSSYVTDKVTAWAKKTSAAGDFEVEQTPQMVPGEGLNGPVVLMRVKRTLPEQPFPAGKPALTVETYPEGAQVTLNGAALGAGPVSTSLPKGGAYTVKVQAPGYAPLERSVTVLDGYGQQLVVRLEPVGGGAAGDAYRRAQEAEARQQWEVAEASYAAAITADPKFVPAYDGLADLQIRKGRPRNGIRTLINLVAQAPSAHAYGRLATAYALFAQQGPGKDDNVADKKGSGGFSVPDKQDDAKKLARKAADEAVKADANSAEAQRALGFALVATDDKGKNKRDALAAFAKAVALDAKDAANHYGLGFGIRAFAAQIKEEPARNAELERAVTSLKQSLDLRPDYYDAHRELAYCYHLMGQNQPARRQYEMANAHRGAATNDTEVAGVNCALSTLHKQEAQSASGERKQEHEAASGGYLEDAREITPNLEQALRMLSYVGLSARMTDYLPAELRRFLNFSVEQEIRNRIRLPGGIRLPR